MGSGEVVDGTMGQSEEQKKEIWGLRETVTLALGKRGGVYKYDFSLPTEEMYDMVEEVDKKGIFRFVVEKKNSLFIRRCFSTSFSKQNKTKPNKTKPNKTK